MFHQTSTQIKITPNSSFSDCLTYLKENMIARQIVNGGYFCHTSQTLLSANRVNEQQFSKIRKQDSVISL